MAADSLEAAAEEAGADLVVETQGSSGSTPLTKEQIERAVAVIFAADVGVKDRARFAGMPVVQSGVKRAINEPAVMVEEALQRADDPNAPRVEGDANAVAEDEGQGSAGTKLRQWLMTGVSYMIPFVAAGGLLIALGFLLGWPTTWARPDDGLGAAADALTIESSLLDLPEGGLLQYLGAVAFKLGSLGFGFLVPALAGYIAYAIADRPGIAPGFIVGQVAGVRRWWVHRWADRRPAGRSRRAVDQPPQGPRVGARASCPWWSSPSAPRSWPVARCSSCSASPWRPQPAGWRAGSTACPAATCWSSARSSV